VLYINGHRQNLRIKFTKIETKVIEMSKKRYSTLQFMVYLYDNGLPNEEAQGAMAFYDRGKKQISQQTFNHWDEIPGGIRKLMKKAGYFKQTDQNGWTHQKR
jgi:hypothetical protein